MKPSKSGNEVESTMKSTTKHAFLPPGSIGKGRGRGLDLKSMSSLGMSGYAVGSFRRNSLSASQGMRTMSKSPSTLDKENMQINFRVPPSSDTVMKYIQTLEKDEVESFSKSSICASQGIGKRSTNPLALEKDDMQTDIVMPPATEKVVKCTQPSETRKGPGQGIGLKSMYSTGVFEDEVRSLHKSSLCASQGMQKRSTNPLAIEKDDMQTESVVPPATKKIVKYTQPSKTSDIGKGSGQGIGLKSMYSSGDSEDEVRSLRKSSLCASQGMPKRSTNPLAIEKDDMQTEFVVPPATKKVMKYSQPSETDYIGKVRGRGRGLRSMSYVGVSREEMEPLCDSSQGMTAVFNSKRSDSTIYASQEMGTTKKNSVVLEKEHMQTDTTLPPSTDQVMEDTQIVETNVGISTARKVKRVRGKNKCKEVASLEVGQKLKVTFYQNRTVGETGKSFSRHLGIIVRDRNMCPFGVSSWRDIKEERLNHMWAAIEDKFESDDMDIHREHIFEWMKQIWNRWRGNLHARYVRGKPIQEALRNVPKGVDKKQWEWLVKNHFLTESFQAKSERNRVNRAKWKMPHRIGSKPIREIIYQKGGKDGNPPDMATIFFETRKKNEKLVDSESIEKHAQLQELVQSEPSLSTIEIVEKCFGPQNCSHVFGFGGGVKAKDLKGGAPSKSELMSELRSSREENQALRGRFSTVESDIKELKELLLAQHSNAQPSATPISEE